MTGPEHYAAAEDLLDQLAHDDPVGFDYPTDQMIAMAGIHAQLALAAATALNDADEGLTRRQHQAWVQVADRGGQP